MNIILIISFFLLSLLLWFFYTKKVFNNKSLNLKLLSIKLPKDIDDKNGDFKSKINLSEQLFSALEAIGQPIALEMAVHNVGEDINFYIAVPRQFTEFVEGQIQGLFPDAQVTAVNDYNIFHRDGGHSIANVQLNDFYLLPIRTYQESENDTFAPIVSTLSKLNEIGDGACLQLVINPVEKSLKNYAVKVIDSLKKGTRLKDLNKDSFLKNILKELGLFIFNNKADELPKEKLVDEEAIKLTQAKISKPLFMVNIRLVSSSGTQDRAEDIILSLAGAFNQFTTPSRNRFFINKIKRKKNELFNYIFREFSYKQSIVLNTEELASIFHLPVYTTDVPRIKWVRTKEAPPPDNLPDEGLELGVNIFRGREKKILISDDDRRRHFYIIGQTGTGKSFSMLSMITQDMNKNKGLCVIDPHGELVDDVLQRVPKHRIDDVIVFDPGDISRPLGLNMLEYNIDKPEEKTFIVNEIQSIFNRLFDKETMGPMFEQYMRNALLLLMEDAKNEPATLMEVPRIFTDSEFRNKKLNRITNPTVIDFWSKEAIKTTGEQGLANITPYITSKFGNFIANDYMRPIIGQTKSAFNFRKVMDDQKILLVNLSKGKIGDINAGLLGMIVTGRILLAALSRTDVDVNNRKDFYLYIDEFQNFTTDSISVILSEARKYRLNLILAHQFISQLTDDIREAVFGNVGSMSSFRVGTADAEVLVKQLGPVFSEKDLITVENQHAFVKMLVNGEPTNPFNLKTPRVNSGSPDIKDKLKELSRLTYGRDLVDIEQDIINRLRNF